MIGILNIYSYNYSTLHVSFDPLDLPAWSAAIVEASCRVQDPPSLLTPRTGCTRTKATGNLLSTHQQLRVTRLDAGLPCPYGK
jgi:hypothetical protein